MKVKTREQAWEEANKLYPTDYVKDVKASIGAGYDIYKHPNFNDRIADLGCRLEVTVGNKTTNIWIDSNKPDLKLKDFLKMINEPVQVVVQEKGQCFKFACMSNSFHAEEAMERSVYEISSVVVFSGNAKISVTVW